MSELEHRRIQDAIEQRGRARRAAEEFLDLVDRKERELLPEDVALGLELSTGMSSCKTGLSAG